MDRAQRAIVDGPASPCKAPIESTLEPDLQKGAGLGYGLNSEEMPLSPNPRTCFWGGWGGSLIIVDLDARLAIAYVMNKMGEGTLGDARGASIVAATYGSLA